jgi:hypothetical protein
VQAIAGQPAASDHDTNRLPKGSKIFERDALYQPALLSSVVRTSMT